MSAQADFPFLAAAHSREWAAAQKSSNGGGYPQELPMYDDYDYPPPRRMQPGTLLALSLIGACLVLGLLVAIVAIASRPSEPTPAHPAVARHEPRTVSRDERRPTKELSPVRAPSTPAQPPATKRPIEAKAAERDEGRPSLLARPAGPVIVQPQLPAASELEPVPEEPDEPVAVPGKLLPEVVPGYQTRQLQGFSLLLSTQAIREGAKHRGKPFGALQAEFDGLVRVLPASALKHLRGILVWVEWDNIDRENPKTLAKYYGGRIWRLDGSAHPLKSNAVEVLSLKLLAEEKAAAREKSSLILLHELAHAVHHLALGHENPAVVFAYNQAMDRRLYDKVKDAFGRECRAYAATNNAEYFAELSCAYLDRCRYFPFTRAELAEHDPTGFRLMQSVWGDGDATAGQPAKNQRSARPRPSAR